ncbi:MAG: hypothetical protein HYX67_17620 [Candidatus Melainabacteria bacterium]|nr:hypothetical protein [Candidatus Melainabacteria bacterium]
MLSFAQKWYIEPRLLKIKGSGGGTQVRRFSQADIAGGIAVHVESGSGLPRTRAGRQARILSYVQTGILRPDQAYKHLDLGDMKSVAVAFQAQEDQALREHDRLNRGEMLNDLAYQQTLGSVQQGINPESQQQIQNQQEAQELLQRAALSPQPFENYQVHLDAHSLFMTSPEFEALPLQIKQSYIMHFELTLQAMQALPSKPEPLPVRTNLQLRGTIGPTGASQILQRAGVVGITPEIMTEPPLETWVSDSVDKPDVDVVGQMDPSIQEAGAVHEMSLKDQAHTIEQIRLAELHAAKAVEAQARAVKAVADAKLAARTANEKTFTPKVGK